MQGVCLFHLPSATSTLSAEPALVALTPPRCRVGTWPAVIDTGALLRLLNAYPSSFFLLVLETERPPRTASTARDDCTDALITQWIDGQDDVRRFFELPSVQQRTCRLILGDAAPVMSSVAVSTSRSEDHQSKECCSVLGGGYGPSPSSSAGVPSLQGRRHVLQLSSLTAAHVMRQQPWLNELHECQRSLTSFAQVAAALLTGPPHFPPFYTSMETVLELVAQCDDGGDVRTGAVLLECITQAIRARRRCTAAISSGAHAGDRSATHAAIAEARKEPRLIPLWICGGDTGSADLPLQRPGSRALDGAASVAPSLMGAPVDELIISEAYSTYITSERAIRPNPSTAASESKCTTAPRSPARRTSADLAERAFSGCVQLTSRGGDTEPSYPRGRVTTSSASVAAIAHLLICTMWDAPSSPPPPAATDPPSKVRGELLHSFLWCLHQRARRPLAAAIPTTTSDSSHHHHHTDAEAEVQYRVYLCCNGRDALQGKEAVHAGAAASLSSSPTCILPSGEGKERAPERKTREWRACGLAEAVAQLTPGSLETAFDEDTLGRTADEKGALSVADSLEHAHATLQRIFQEAHTQRLLSLCGGAAQRQDGPPALSELAASTSTKGHDAPLTSAAVLLFLDELHLAAWMRTPHSLLASPSMWRRDVPLHICLLPSLAVSSSMIQQHLCELPWIWQGLQAAQQLCCWNHGGLYVCGGTYEAIAPRRRIRAFARAMASRIHRWNAALYRNLYLCIFSELAGSPSDQRRSRSEQSTPTATEIPGGHIFPNEGEEAVGSHCDICLPASTMEHRTAVASLRLWRGTAATLSTSSSVWRFLRWDDNTVMESGTSSGRQWACETVPQLGFAFAGRASQKSHVGVRWAASHVVRVQPRLSLFPSSHQRSWYERHVVLHDVLCSLDLLVEAQVEHVKEMFFLCVSTGEGRRTRQPHLSALQREILAERVRMALRQLTHHVDDATRGDAAVMDRLHRLEPLELSPESARAPSSPSVLLQSRMISTSVALPPKVCIVVQEVEQLRREAALPLEETEQSSLHEKSTVAPSAEETSKAVQKLLALLLLRARVLQTHVDYATGDDEGNSDDDDETDENICERYCLSGGGRRRGDDDGAKDDVASSWIRSSGHFVGTQRELRVSLARDAQSAEPELVDEHTEGRCLPTELRRSPTPPLSSRPTEEPSTPTASGSKPHPLLSAASAASCTPPSVNLSRQVGLPSSPADSPKEMVLLEHADFHVRLPEGCGPPFPVPAGNWNVVTPHPDGDEAFAVYVDRETTSVGQSLTEVTVAEEAFDVHVSDSSNTSSDSTARPPRAFRLKQAPLTSNRYCTRKDEPTACATFSEREDLFLDSLSWRQSVPARVFDDGECPAPSVDESQGPSVPFFPTGIETNVIPVQGLVATCATWANGNERNRDEWPEGDDCRREALQEQPRPPVPPYCGVDAWTADSAEDGFRRDDFTDGHAPGSPPLLLPRDLQWCAWESCSRGSVTTPVSSIAALLATRLPASGVTSTTSVLSVAHYSSGRLTVDVLNPTVAWYQLKQAEKGTTCPERARGHEEQHQQPCAHLALLSLDTTNGLLRLWEAIPCSLEPDDTTWSPEQRVVAGTPSGLLRNVPPCAEKLSYTFASSIAPGSAIAVVYLGLRQPFAAWVSQEDVRWISGIAVALERPTLAQVRVVGVQKDCFQLEWASSTTPVKVCVTELATPEEEEEQQPVCTFTKVATSGITHNLMHDAVDAAEEDKDECITDGVRVGRTFECVWLSSPALVRGLRSGCIYYVELMSLCGSRLTVTLGHPQRQHILLDTVVDVGAHRVALLAATSFEPGMDVLRVEDVQEKDTSWSPPKSSSLSREITCPSANLTKVVPAVTRAPVIRGRLVCPYPHYVTQEFALLSLRYCALVPQDAAPEERVRLHLFMVPTLQRDGDRDGVGRTEVSVALEEHEELLRQPHEEEVEIRGASGSSAQPTSDLEQLSLRLIKDGRMRHYNFEMQAGEASTVSVSLRVQLMLERTTATVQAPPYLTLLDHYDRLVRRVQLGPFHVCRPVPVVLSIGATECELAWEGSDSTYDVHLHVSAELNGVTAKVAGGNETAHDPTPSKMCRSSPAPSDELWTRFRVLGQLIRGTSESHEATTASLNFFRATLHLSALRPSFQYTAKIRCANNHVGPAQSCSWWTCPSTPPISVSRISFDSCTRQLRVLLLPPAPRWPGIAAVTYRAVVNPLGEVVELTAERGRRVSSESVDPVERVIDCRGVPRGTPLFVELRQRSVCTTKRWPGTDVLGQHASTQITAESAAVMHYVVSDVQARILIPSSLIRNVSENANARKDASLLSASESEHPVMELSWTCVDQPADAEPVVAAVVFNGEYRVPVHASDPHHLRLTLTQLRLASGSVRDAGGDDSNGTDVRTACQASCDEENEGKSAEVAHLWKGVLCITAFVGPSPPVVSDDPGRVRHIIVPDRCLTVVLPPPSRLSASVFRLYNYEAEACVYVDSAAIYRQYFQEILQMPWQCGRSNNVVDRVEGDGYDGALRSTADLKAQLQRDVRLSLEVSSEMGGVLTTSSTQRYPIQVVSPAESVQLLQIPLRTNRPYDGHLHFSLYVSVAGDDTNDRVTGSPGSSVNRTTLYDAVPSSGLRANIASHVRLLVPRASSVVFVSISIPPAEPIEGITVSAITANEASVSWVPPLTLRRHLSQHLDMAFSYDVELRPAYASAATTSLPREGPTAASCDAAAQGSSLATLDMADSTRKFKTCEPQLTLTTLHAGMVYLVTVRGTGYGHYYSSAAFVTAPVAPPSVVSQICASAFMGMADAAEAQQTASSHAARRSGMCTGCSRSRRTPPAAQTPVMMAQLPASRLVSWRLPPIARDTSAGTSLSLPIDITVVTHYTAALVAPTGELLQQWTSTLRATTALRYALPVTSTANPFSSTCSLVRPHLELMTHAEVLAEGEAVLHMGTATSLSSVASPFLRRTGMGKPRNFFTADRRQSGAYARIRIDLVGFPRLVSSSSASACTVAWEGTSNVGYDISWCSSADPQRVHHKNIPAVVGATGLATGASVAASGLAYHTLSEPTGAAAQHPRSSSHSSGDNDFPLHTGVPVYILLCVQCSRTGNSGGEAGGGGGGGGDCRTRGKFSACSSSCGSNALYAAWLLSPPPTRSDGVQQLQPPLQIFRRTASAITFLLPYPNSLACFVGGDVLLSGTTKDIPASCSAALPALRRTYTVVACSPHEGEGGSPSPRDCGGTHDAEAVNPRVRPWKEEQYAAAGIPVVPDGLALVDVCIPLPSRPSSQVDRPHGPTRDEENVVVVELRCTDVVEGSRSPIWQRIFLDTLLGAHHRHFNSSSAVGVLHGWSACNSSGPASPSSSTAMPMPLIWLRTLSETRQRQKVQPACILEDLVVGSTEEAGTVVMPPSIDLDAAGNHRDSCSTRSAVKELTLQPPYRAANPPPHRAVSDTTRDVIQEECALKLFVGTIAQEGPQRTAATAQGDCTSSEDCARVAATSRTELASLQAWTQRGNPTLRVRLQWMSTDNAFTVRVAGPYQAAETIGRAAGEAEVDGERRAPVASVLKAISTLRNASSPLRTDLLNALREALLEEEPLPSTLEMPHQRTYHCLPLRSAGAFRGPGESGLHGEKVDASAKPTSFAACPGAATLSSIVRYTAVVDGLLPEAVYRVQVTGRRCGDSKLRAQFLTPPSSLVQVVTVSEAATVCHVDQVDVVRKAAEGKEQRCCFSPKQQLRLGISLYDPHGYRAMYQPRMGEQALSAHYHRHHELAPGLPYRSRTILEVCSAASGRCRGFIKVGCDNAVEADEHTQPLEPLYDAAPEDVRVTSGLEAAHASIQEATLSLDDVEEAVLVIAERQLDLVLPGPPEKSPPQQSRTWGPLLWPTAARVETTRTAVVRHLGEEWGSFEAVAGDSDSATRSSTTKWQLRRRQLLCYVPQCPRMSGLAVGWRTSQSLQLSWRWWPGQSSGLNFKTILEGTLWSHSREGSADAVVSPRALSLPNTKLYVTTRRVGAALPCKATASPRQLSSDDADGCVRMIPTCPSPTVTLAPLLPGSLYEIRIREIAPRSVADVRVHACRTRRDTADRLEPLMHEQDLHAIRRAQLSVSATAAVQALARSSKRPASLVVVQPDGDGPSPVPCGRNGSTRLTRGEGVCYVLTPPAPDVLCLPAPPKPFAEQVRRRPSVMTLTLPQCANAINTTHREAGVRVVSYIAVMVIPENVLYIPTSAVAELRQWWRDTHQECNEDTENEWWQWWAQRTQATMYAEWWSHSSRARTHRPSTAAAKAAVLATPTTAAPTSLRAAHWSNELAQHVFSSSDDGALVHGGAGSCRLRIRLAPFTARRMQLRKRDGLPNAPSWQYDIPIVEPTTQDARGGGSQRVGINAEDTSASRTAYVLCGVEALFDGDAAGDGRAADVVAGTQQLAVVHAPIQVQRLKLIHDLRVCGKAETITAPSPSPSSASSRGCASFRVSWNWSSWATRRNSVARHGALPSLPPCTARILCIPLPPVINEAGGAKKSTSDSESDSNKSDEADAVFVRQVEVGASAVDVTGLAPATLHRLELRDVRLATTESGVWTRGEDVTVVAITPPAPFLEEELPQLRYRLIERKMSSVSLEQEPPISVEVQLQLPTASTQAQGLRVVPYAVLVSLSIVDTRGCRTAADFLAAVAEEEKAAPPLQQPQPGIIVPQPPTVRGKVAMSASKKKNVSYMFRNTSSRQPLNTAVTLRRPLQQRYVVAFFKGVPATVSAVQDGIVGEQGDTAPGDANGSERIATSAHPRHVPMLFSTPVISSLKFPFSVHAACRGASVADKGTPTCSSLVTRPILQPRGSFRNVFGRLSRLYVQQRTHDCLTLRWQLDLSRMRWSEAERRSLLRSGVFLVTITRNTGTLEEENEQATAAAGAMAEAPFARKVFYRCNTVPTPQTGSTAAARTATKMATSASRSSDALPESCLSPKTSAGEVSGPPRHTAAGGGTTEFCVPLRDYYALNGTDGHLSEKNARNTSADPKARDHDPQLSSAAVTPPDINIPEEQSECFLYELPFSYSTHAAAHAGYEVTVSLPPYWVVQDTEEAGEASSRSWGEERREASAEHTSRTIKVPPVLWPPAVQHIIVAHTSPTTCTLRWTTTGAAEQLPTGATYLVEYEPQETPREGDTAESLRELSVAKQVWVAAKPFQPNTVTLEMLRPSTLYTVRVVPHNALGEPRPSSRASVTVLTQ